MTNEQSTVPEFGGKQPGRIYVSRPSAYGLIYDAQGRIAVLETPHGIFLPGGGIEEGEPPEDALRREVREECGFEVLIGARIGEAAEYRDTPGHAFAIRKDCIFFTARIIEASGTATEPDHTLIWLEPSEAESRLAHGSQQWIVRESLMRFL